MARKTKSVPNCRAGAPPAVVEKHRQPRRLPYKPVAYAETPEKVIPLGSANPLDGIVLEDPVAATESGGRARWPSAPSSAGEQLGGVGHTALPLAPIYRDDAHGIWLYHGNCLSILDAIAAKHPEGCFDMIFADPPYFLSNGGITCHAGKMVKVDKGDWDSSAKVFGADKSRATDFMHEFNTEWLKRCQKVLKPNGTIWVTGTYHVIFSVGYAMQQLGMKILNDIAWEKPNPPPNLSCRYFTHSTETVLWAAKTEKSKHVFNYKAMKRENHGKQMKTVWTMTAPKNGEKTFGKHPTQKPIALVERCILASTRKGDIVCDPFMGGGTTGIGCVRTQRKFVGIELDEVHARLAAARTRDQIVHSLPFEVDA